MVTPRTGDARIFRVLDGMPAPYRGQIVRLRLAEGSPPSLKELKKARFRARSPEGREQEVRALGFAIVGGRPSDGRLSRTGRVDLIVEAEDGTPGDPIGPRWELVGPLA